MIETVVVATDVGGSHLCSAIIDLSTGEMINTSVYNTYYDSFASRESIINVWRQHFSQFRDYQNFSMAFPGPFDYDRGIAHYYPGHKLGEFAGESFYSLFENDILGRGIQLRFENDAKCFGLGAALTVENHHNYKMLFLTLGTGLGSCMIHQGRLIEGSNEFYQMPYQSGTADEYFSTRWFVNYMDQNYDVKYQGVKEIVTDAPEPEVHELFEVFATNLFNFLKPVLDQNQIELIVLGGSISKAEELIRQHLEPKLINPQVTLSFVRDTLLCSLMGAASLYNPQYESINRM